MNRTIGPHTKTTKICWCQIFLSVLQYDTKSTLKLQMLVCKAEILLYIGSIVVTLITQHLQYIIDPDKDILIA